MMIHRLSRLALLPLAIALICSATFAQKAKRPAKSKPIGVRVVLSPAQSAPQKRRLEAFATAWATINQNYFDKTFGGLDWLAVRAEYEPKVRAAKTDAAFHVILDEMINRLGKSHLSVIVPEYFEQIETAKKQARRYEKRVAAGLPASGSSADAETDADDDEPMLEGSSRYGIGVELRMLDKQIVVSRVDEKSGAVLAGLRPGYTIQKVNGVSIADMIDEAVIGGSSMAEITYLFPIQLVESFLNGPPATSLQLIILDENDKPRELTVQRLALAGETISISENFPEQFLKYEARALSPEIGYIKFNAFAVPVIGKFCDSLTEFRDKKAVIVDLRGNLGGVLGSMVGLSGMLADKPFTLGTVVSRTRSDPFRIEPKVKQFKGRVVFLVDELSMSATEIFAAGMQGNKRAIVVGTKTGGQSLPSIWTKLATGAVLLYPIADFITPKGISLEGVGLEPDVKVELSRKSLLAGVDTQLAKAEGVALERPLPDEIVRPPVKAHLDGPPPPPPVRLSTAALSQTNQLFTLTGETSPPPPTAPLAASDTKSLKVLADFAAAAGGSEAFRSITSYEANGSMVIGANGKPQATGAVYTARQFPDKYLMVLNTPAAGEVRESYNGKTSLLQTDAGVERPLLQAGMSAEQVHVFAPLFNMAAPEHFKHLKYEGEFEIDGRKRHIISGREANGWEVGMSFDSATKMLVTYTLPGLLYTFSDFRKVGAIHLPFAIEMENISKTTFASIILNGKLDAALFEKKEKCFDKAL